MSGLSSDDLFRVNDIGERFERLWRRGERPRIEGFLQDHCEPLRRALLQHLIGIELELLRMNFEQPRREAYEERFPEDRAAVAAAFFETPEAWPPPPRFPH
jgi:hypothetical protein